MSDPAAILRALQPVFRSLERAKVVYFMHVSATCVFVYDHLTTFSDEVELVWPTAWNAGKIFFLIERYLTWPELLLTIYRESHDLVELSDVDPQFCHNMFTYISWSTTFAIIVTDMILVLRTWALWGARRSILAFLVLFLIAVAAADSVIVVYYIDKTVFMRAADAIPVLHGCVIKSSTNRIAIGWIVLTSFELVIVVLTLIKGIAHFRTGHSNLITSLYRDGILYFVYLFALSLCNLLFIYTAPKEYIALFGPMQRAFNAILSCKIIMHLQAALTVRASTAATEELSTEMALGSSADARANARRVLVLDKMRPSQRSYNSEWLGASSTV
ncbi:hypothetical protein AURDEDRAFT_166132 [Auricularia subglabra TFB-10046 SS5]|nr:hypothetical protein AURDEDRAFT_166132 [Auricularia subglabra TFB-10046 SS5]